MYIVIIVFISIIVMLGLVYICCIKRKMDRRSTNKSFGIGISDMDSRSTINSKG